MQMALLKIKMKHRRFKAWKKKNMAFFLFSLKQDCSSPPELCGASILPATKGQADAFDATQRGGRRFGNGEHRRWGGLVQGLAPTHKQGLLALIFT